MSASAVLGICLGTAPVVALGVATAPLQETMSVVRDIGESLGSQYVAPPPSETVAAHVPSHATRASSASPRVSPEPETRRASNKGAGSSERPSKKSVGPNLASRAEARDAPKPKKASQSRVAPTAEGRPEKSAAAPPSIPMLPVRSDASRCEDVYVYIVTDALDGSAVATLALGKKARGRPRRVGHRLGDYQVIAIGSLGFAQGPGVWLSKDDEVCVAPLSADNPVRKHRRKVEAAKAKRIAKAKAKRKKAKRKAKRRAKLRARRRR